MKHIVIVDDDPGIQDAFRLIFDRDQYEITIYASGTSILNDEYILPDIFILDKQLSGLDGLDICRYLKNHKSTKDIPVIILSASKDIGRQARQAGADEVVEKPFKVKAVREIVDSFMNR